jgi:hypothetical protein
MGIVYRTLATHITKKAGYNKKTAQTAAVTLIQRFDDEHPVHYLLGNLRLSTFIPDEFVAQR